MDYIQIFLILAIIVLLVLAIYWEIKDYQRIKARPFLCDIKCSKKREEELEFHACFNARNNVQWRGIFIMSFFAAVLVVYIIQELYCLEIGFNLFLLTFAAILIVFYIGSTFRTFHLYRDMCARVKSDKNIL